MSHFWCGPEYRRLPGTPLDMAAGLEEDVRMLKTIANGILGEIGVGSLGVLDDLVVEAGA